MPMNRKLYPENWEAIALQVKQQANWQCQKCGKSCRRKGESLIAFSKRIRVPLYDIEGVRQRYTLTVAHVFDPEPMNVAPSNLMAMCAPCHLRLDAKLHATNRKRNQAKRLEELGQTSLLEVEQ